MRATMLACKRALFQAPRRLTPLRVRAPCRVAAMPRLYSTEAAQPEAAAPPPPSATPETTTVAPPSDATPAPELAAKPAPMPAPKPVPKPAPKAAAKPVPKPPDRLDLSSPSPNEAVYAAPNAPQSAGGHAPAAVDWASSFRGISERPVTAPQLRALTAPLVVQDVEVKPDGVLYLPEIKYRRRLNQVFGPMGWGLVPRGEAVVGESIVTREYALIADGRFAAQAQGENNYFGADQLPSAVEGCKSNALMRCCKDLGIASELWDPNFVRWFRKAHMEERWVEHATTKKRRIFWYKKGMATPQYPWKIATGGSGKSIEGAGTVRSLE